MNSNFLRAWCVSSVFLLVTACAPSAYTVTSPTPSALKVEKSATPAPAQIAFNDQRAPDQQVFHSGILAATLQYNNAPIDPPTFLREQLQEELKSRGIDSKIVVGNDGLPRIDLRNFRMENARTNAYTPFITFTYISADLQMGPTSKRIGVFVKRGKVPVWSFDEIIEPTLNQPLSLAVKELAAKIAMSLGNYRSSDSEVDALEAKLKQRNELSYLDVYSLGFTNNRKALPVLLSLLKDSDEYVRLAAISSIGTLGNADQLSTLKAISEQTDGIWQDRAMALKSIGDLGTPEGKAYLAARLKALSAASNDKEAVWTSRVIALYL